jgi:hypothetical protein
MKYRVYLFYSLFLLAFAGCSTKDKTLFQLLDQDDTGITFKNQIFENDKVNILELEYVYNGGGVSVGDFNNDGLKDLFFTGNMIACQLYLNRGDLEFEDISEPAGIGGFYKWKSGSAVVDINGDGWLDIYVCTTISGDSTMRRNMLFVNQGVDKNGIVRFEDQAAKYKIDYSGFSSNAGFFDYDRDGDLDLYIITNRKLPGVAVTWRAKINDGTSLNTDKLFRNNGDGTFSDVSLESGIICEGYGLGLAFPDVNGDGWQDIYVSNDYITNDLLYINQKNGTFKNEIDQYIRHQSKFSMGNDAADINNDGLLDIMTVDMLPDNNLRKKTVIGGAGYITYINDGKFGYAHQYIRNMLQLNNGNNTFSEIGQMAGVYQTEWSWSPLFADFDNDGFKDLIVTNGFPRDVTDRDFISYREKTHGLATREDLLSQVPSVKVPNVAFHNNGDLTFSEVSKSWGLDAPSFSNGAAFADLDNDGDLDYIINNINDVAAVYENTLNDPDNISSHFLRVRLKGTKENPMALGTKVTLHQGNQIQFAEQSVYRGYLSTVEDIVHFGLGTNTAIDSLTIIWPNGVYQSVKSPKPDAVLNFTQPASGPSAPVKTKTQTLFKKLNSIAYKNIDADKIDFNIQRTLPHKLSQAGPGMAVGDINGDGLEDLVIGGSALNSSVSFLQKPDGSFTERPIIKDKKMEDEGMLLFDADQDGDNDLYCVSGSYEYEPGSESYQDRLYLNDGRGNFKLNAQALPEMRSSGSCVRAGDFDSDGDLDLFVGGKTPPGRYPLPEKSYLLLNEHGTFKDVTAEHNSDLGEIGMVNDALWSDYNNDGWVDLMVAGEFMPITIFRNNNGKLSKFESPDLQAHVGWFNSISGADLDNDGDTDYIAGNLGINNYFNCTPEHPVTVFAKDFDNNGSIDAILSCYVKSETGELKPFPVHFWDELNGQSPKFRQRYNYFHEYARITTDKFFSPEELKDSKTLTAGFLKSTAIINEGNGKFTFKPFSNITQIAPVNGIVLTDVNQDNIIDACLVGNDYGNEPTYGQYDAFTGQILLGKGDGTFDAKTSVQTGFQTTGDAKSLVRLTNAKGKELLVVGQNKDSVLVFGLPETSARTTFEPQKFDQSIVVSLPDGKKQKIEFYYGSGYLSQSSRRIYLPKGTENFEIKNFQGKSRSEKIRQ